MNNFLRKNAITILLTTICILSCTSEINENDHDRYVMKTIVTKSSGDSIRVYEKLPNPYTLNVMQRIYDDYSTTDVALEPTDLYVCFMPKDSTQFKALMQNEELELFNYPLDVILEEGEEYVNPDIEEGDIGWSYTTVSPDFEFPNDIDYIILDTCYIPAEGEVIVQTKGNDIDVEAIALGRLGYIDTTDVATKASSHSFPSGSIQVVVDTIRPVKGVKVRCNNIVKWATAYTDEQGNYTINKSFKTDVHYAIVFENIKGFDLWGNLGPLARANHNLKKHSPVGHSTVISQTNKAWDLAVVNNAAYDYYNMCDTTGISTPPDNISIWVDKNAGYGGAPMLSKVDINPTLDYHPFLSFILNDIEELLTYKLLEYVLPDVIIGTNGRTMESINKLVSHELSHVSHFSTVGNSFWSRYITYIVDNIGYGDGTGQDAELCAIGEMWANFMEEILYWKKSPTTYIPSRYNGYVSVNWIIPHVFWDLYASHTFTTKQIYDCLTPEIDTYEKLLNKMTTLYPDKADFIKWLFFKYGLVIKNVDVCSCPNADDVQLNYPFDISWGYSTDENVHDIEFRVIKEKYFEEPTFADISIQKDTTCKYKAQITIKNYGYYIIEAEALGTSQKRYFHIAKHYRDLSIDQIPEPIYIEGTEPMQKLGTRVGSPYTTEVTFGSTAQIQTRTIALARVNYKQLTTGTRERRVDVRHVYAEQDTLKLNVGSSSTVTLPGLYNYIYREEIFDPVDSDLEHHPEYITYTTESEGYYTISYPDDICKWIK